MTKNRKEHLEWCKTRANQLIDRNDLSGALASFTSDMMKHPDTKDHKFLRLGITLSAMGHLSTKDLMRSHINGYN